MSGDPFTHSEHFLDFLALGERKDYFVAYKFVFDARASERATAHLWPPAHRSLRRPDVRVLVITNLGEVRDILVPSTFEGPEAVVRQHLHEAPWEMRILESERRRAAVGMEGSRSVYAFPTGLPSHLEGHPVPFVPEGTPSVELNLSRPQAAADDVHQLHESVMGEFSEIRETLRTLTNQLQDTEATRAASEPLPREVAGPTLVERLTISQKKRSKQRAQVESARHRLQEIGDLARGRTKESAANQ